MPGRRNFIVDAEAGDFVFEPRHADAAEVIVRVHLPTRQQRHLPDDRDRRGQVIR